mmetsp:Transcript_65872/g.170269  ORF Transcript_65872/g.170269 Transcript_65872/m.170269 type:complete len:205 (-) Transcript_65872:351-965(-)
MPQLVKERGAICDTAKRADSPDGLFGSAPSVATLARLLAILEPLPIRKHDGPHACMHQELDDELQFLVQERDRIGRGSVDDSNSMNLDGSSQVVQCHGVNFACLLIDGLREELLMNTVAVLSSQLVDLTHEVDDIQAIILRSSRKPAVKNCQAIPLLGQSSHSLIGLSILRLVSSEVVKILAESELDLILQIQHKLWAQPKRSQ